MELDTREHKCRRHEEQKIIQMDATCNNNGQEQTRWPSYTKAQTRLADDSSFVADGMGHLRPYLTPCTKADKGGPAGGVAFLVKAEFERAELIIDHRSMTAEEFYGAEGFAAELTLKHETGTIKRVSTYVRQRSGAEHDAYEYKNLEKLSTLKSNLLVMGSINGSTMYTEPREPWSKRGLGSQAKDAEAINSRMEKIGHHIKRMWNKMQTTDISSRGTLRGNTREMNKTIRGSKSRTNWM